MLRHLPKPHHDATLDFIAVYRIKTFEDNLTAGVLYSRTATVLISRADMISMDKDFYLTDHVTIEVLTL